MSDTFTVALSPPPGLDSDDSTFAAQGRWADGSNVRFYNGAPQSIGPYSVAVSVPPALTVTELAVFSSTGSTSSSYLIMGCVAELKTSLGFGTVTDISPVGIGASNQTWSFAPYGNTVLCKGSGTSGIFQHTLGGGAATVIATAPADATCILVARRQALAFGCNEEVSTNFNGRCIRGSDIEDVTDWTTTSTNSSFEDILDDESSIVTAKVIGDYVAVWTATSLWMGTFLGNPDQIYQWEKVAGGHGATSPNSACVSGTVATWFAPDYQIWQWSPGAVPMPVPCPISKAFTDNLDNTNFIRVVALPHFGEIWVIYTSVTSFDLRADAYIAFNQQGQWFKGTFQRNAVFANGLASALIRSSFGDNTPAGVFLAAHGADVYAHELSSGTQPGWSLTSADQYLAEGRSRTLIKRLVPDFKDSTGTITLTLSMRAYPQATPVSKGPYTIAANATKVDFRASGMIVEAEFSGSHFARFGKPTFDCVALGER